MTKFCAAAFLLLALCAALPAREAPTLVFAPEFPDEGLRAGDTLRFRAAVPEPWRVFSHESEDEFFPPFRAREGAVFDRFRDIVVSGDERLVKPDTRLFQVLLDRYSLQAQDCIFVDDNPDNVAAACKMGMEGIVFHGAEDLRKKLGL